MNRHACTAAILVVCAGCFASVPDRAADTVEPTEPAAHEPGRVPEPGPYAPGFDALHYRIAVELPGEGVRFSGRTTVDIEMVEPRRDTLRLDLTGLAVRDVEVGVGASPPSGASFRQWDGRLYVPVPAAARTGDTLRVAVRYGGVPDDGLILRRNVHGRWGAFADNWPDRARFWFPSIDHPSDKATVEFEVRAPAGWQVVANGAPSDGAAGETTAGDGVWRFRMSEPIPTYLMVIGAAEFATSPIAECARAGDADRCVPVGFLAFPQDSANAARIFARAGAMLEYYVDRIAPFPYARLDHVQSATRFGGMENATAIFYSERAIAEGRLSEVTVAHETAHQWFGDAVTPERWAHLWLSEGFATYFGIQFFEHADGAERFRELREQSWRGYLESDVTGIPVVDTANVPGGNLLGLLNANSYNKGGAVLHMLRALLGDDPFFEGVRRYYTRHLHGTAVTEDLQRALEEASGRELGWFFEQWLYRPGHPILHLSRVWDESAGAAALTIEQVQPRTWPVFRLPLDIELTTPAGVRRVSVELTERRTTTRVPLPAPPSAVRLDPDGRVLLEVRGDAEGSAR